MRVFIYKRTHKGDPDAAGRFGIYDCMGRMRDASFDAVIGIGGKGTVPTRQAIAKKVNWIGIGPTKSKKNLGASIVTFNKFELFEEAGVYLGEVAPKLAKRLFPKKNPPRFVFSDSLKPAELVEVEKLLNLVKEGRPAKARTLSKASECHDGCDASKSRCS